jgi:hypothetical protein
MIDRTFAVREMIVENNAQLAASRSRPTLRCEYSEPNSPAQKASCSVLKDPLIQ